MLCVMCEFSRLIHLLLHISYHSLNLVSKYFLSFVASLNFSENIRKPLAFWYFRWDRKGPLAWNGLIMLQLLTIVGKGIWSPHLFHTPVPWFFAYSPVNYNFENNEIYGYSYTTETVLKPKLLNRDSYQGKKDIIDRNFLSV